MKHKIIAWLCRFLSRRCRHPQSLVVYDILEGDLLPHLAQYCRCCGSYRRGNFGGWGEWIGPGDPWMRG